MAFQRIDDIAKLKLPEGTEFVEGINPEQIKNTVSIFTERIVEKILNTQKSQEIIIPSQGSLYIYYQIIVRLKNIDPSVFNRITFRFAVKNGYDENQKPIYELTNKDKDLPEDRETFIVDDIYDSGESSNSILRALNKEHSEIQKLGSLDVYALSKKQSVPNQRGNTKLVDLGEEAMMIYPDKWLMGTFGMNSGLFDFTKTGIYMDLLIDTMERFCNIPIALTKFGKVFTKEEKEIYLNILYNYSDNDIDKTHMYQLLLSANSIAEAENKKKYLLNFHERMIAGIEA